MFSSTLLLLDVGAQEFIIIAFVILLLFGGDKLPELARGLGKGIRDFKNASEDVKREIHKQIDSYDAKNEATEKPAIIDESTAENQYKPDEYNYEDGNFDDVHKHSGVANTMPIGQGFVTATDQLDEEQPVDYYAMKTDEIQDENANVSTNTEDEKNKL